MRRCRLKENIEVQKKCEEYLERKRSKINEEVDREV